MGTSSKQPGRWRRGWYLTKASWTLLRRHKSLIAFPILGTVFAVIAALLLFAPGFAIYAVDQKASWAMIPFGLLAAYAATFFAIFFSVALASCTAKAIDGQPVTVSSGITDARARVGVIAVWALVQLTVGLLLNAIQSFLNDKGGGALVAGLVRGLAGFAWALATFFVIPVIALEGLTPKAAVKKSIGVIKERWGESVVGNAAVGIIGLPFILLSLLSFAGMIGAQKTSVAAAIAFAVIGAVLFFIGMLLTSSLQAVFRVVLFRYAQDGSVPAGWDESALAAAFRPKRSRNPLSR